MISRKKCIVILQPYKLKHKQKPIPSKCDITLLNATEEHFFEINNVIHNSVFRTPSNIYDGTFLKKTVNGLQSLIVSVKKIHHRYLAGS